MVLSICINALGSEVHSSGMRLVRLLYSVEKKNHSNIPKERPSADTLPWKSTQ